MTVADTYDKVIEVLGNDLGRLFGSRTSLEKAIRMNDAIDLLEALRKHGFEVRQIDGSES